MQHSAQKIALQYLHAIRQQGAVGVIGIGGAAIRARLRGGLQTKVVIQTNSVRQPCFCAGAKPTIPIAATVPSVQKLARNIRLDQ